MNYFKIKISTWIYYFWHFLTFFDIFCPIEIDLSGNFVWVLFSGFQKLAKLVIFGIFNELLSTHNVNVAHFARNNECDFLGDFETLCFFPFCKYNESKSKVWKQEEIAKKS